MTLTFTLALVALLAIGVASKEQEQHQECQIGYATCHSHHPCIVGGGYYCCPGGKVYTVSLGPTLISCKCRYDGTYTGAECFRGRRTNGAHGMTSASVLTCALAILGVMFRPGDLLLA